MSIMTNSPHPTVVVGDALIDVLRDDDGERSFVGGAGLNVAIGLSVLGVRSTLMCTLGDDEDAARIRDLLADYSVDVIATPSALGTGRAISERVGGEPRYSFSAAAVSRRIRFDDRARAAIADAPTIAVSCFRFDDDEQAAELAAVVERPGERLIVDPNPRAGLLQSAERFLVNFERLAARALLVKIGDEDSELLYGDTLSAVANRLRSAGASHVLATAGSDGADLLDADGTHHADIAALPGPVIDTMGAGDSVLATVTAGISRGGIPATPHAWTALLTEAMRVAAATCRQEGALLRRP